MRIQDKSWMTFANNRITNRQSSTTKTLEKLSGGDKIVRASMNASGLSISETMRTQIRGLSRAQQNIQDGLSVLEVTDEGLQNVNKILLRTRELAVQAANDSLTDDDRKLVQVEIDQLIESIDKTAEHMEFNAHKILGEIRPLYIQVGANEGQSIAIDTVDVSTTKLGLENANLETQENAGKLISAVDKAIDYIAENLGEIGAKYNRLTINHENTGRVQESIQKSESLIRDPDMAREMMDFVKLQIIQKGDELLVRNTNDNIKSVLNLFNK